MKVKDIMTQTAVCCSPSTDIGAAVELLWVRNCGMLPVVDSNQKVVGVITDRDICIALGTRNRPAGALTVGEISTKDVFTCKAEDEVHEALDTMAGKHVRRLPVVDEHGTPQGVLSVDDIIAHADLNKSAGSHGC